MSVDPVEVEQEQVLATLRRAQLLPRRCEPLWQQKHQAPQAGAAAAAAQEEAVTELAAATAAVHARRTQLLAASPQEAAQAAQAWRERCPATERSAPV